MDAKKDRISSIILDGKIQHFLIAFHLPPNLDISVLYLKVGGPQTQIPSLPSVRPITISCGAFSYVFAVVADDEAVVLFFEKE